MVMRNPELVLYPLKVNLATHMLGILKYFTFCDPARKELTGLLRLLFWGARILGADSCEYYCQPILRIREMGYIVRQSTSPSWMSWNFFYFWTCDHPVFVCVVFEEEKIKNYPDWIILLCDCFLLLGWKTKVTTRRMTSGPLLVTGYWPSVWNKSPWQMDLTGTRYHAVLMI